MNSFQILFHPYLFVISLQCVYITPPTNHIKFFYKFYNTFSSHLSHMYRISRHHQINPPPSVPFEFEHNIFCHIVTRSNIHLFYLFVLMCQLKIGIWLGCETVHEVINSSLTEQFDLKIIGSLQISFSWVRFSDKYWIEFRDYRKKN